jgi:2-polyprenyl-6-methoxyphenol hydroxylase-like FAD-dependent oxidoreductase
MGALNIAVAGCGPAGMAAALLLHRDGHRVVIFERFQTPRPLGSGIILQPTGMAVLRALGVAARVEANGARIDRLYGLSDGATVLDVRYAALGEGHGVGIHRATLFAALYDAVRAEGIPVETGRAIASISEGECRTLAFEGGGQAGPFDLVIDALGAQSRLAAAKALPLAYGALWASLDWPDEAGFEPNALQQRYRAASVMAGVLPIGTPPGALRPQAALFWSLRQDALEAWRKAGLKAWKADVVALWPQAAPLLEQIHDTEQLTFARYAHRTLARPAEPGLIHIGDAWHSTSPQLGQGANMALLDAWALALGLRGAAGVEAGLRRAVGLRRGHVRLYQTMSWLFTPVYQSDGRLVPLLRDKVAGPLSRLWPAPPLLAATVAGLIGSPLGRLGLADQRAV